MKKNELSVRRRTPKDVGLVRAGQAEGRGKRRVRKPNDQRRRLAQAAGSAGKIARWTAVPEPGDELRTGKEWRTVKGRWSAAYKLGSGTGRFPCCLQGGGLVWSLSDDFSFRKESAYAR